MLVSAPGLGVLIRFPLAESWGDRLGGPARPGRRAAPAPVLPPRFTVFAMTGVLIAAGLIVAWMGRRAVARPRAVPR